MFRGILGVISEDTRFTHRSRLCKYDVPDHSIGLGNLSKIILRMNATEGYINHVV